MTKLKSLIRVNSCHLTINSSNGKLGLFFLNKDKNILYLALVFLKMSRRMEYARVASSR